MPIVLNGTTGITTPTYNGNTTAEYLVPVTAFKNRIINGAMVIDQRNAGAQLSNTTSSQYNIDRWNTFNTSVGRFTVQQNAGGLTGTNLPAGFTNYIGITSNAYTMGAGDFFGLGQIIEGYNIADLSWGTANAKTVTLSFWVRSSLTGTFSVGFQNAGTLFTNYTYTISSANTWEYKTITVTPPTTGTWGSTNGTGLNIYWSLGAGSTYIGGTVGNWASTSPYYNQPSGCTNIIGTNGTTFYITGVQLEVGSTATSFDYRPYGTELALCQRYYETSYPIGVAAGTANYVGPAQVSARLTISGYCFYTVSYTVQKRATPSISLWSYNGTANQLGSFDSGANLGASSALQITANSFLLCNNSGGNIADGSPITTNYSASAEL